jgi:hypothetical protein
MADRRSQSQRPPYGGGERPGGAAAEGGGEVVALAAQFAGPLADQEIKAREQGARDELFHRGWRADRAERIEL